MARHRRSSRAKRILNVVPRTLKKTVRAIRPSRVARVAKRTGSTFFTLAKKGLRQLSRSTSKAVRKVMCTRRRR